MEVKKLTAKQERFVQEYLIDLNATQAAIRAGYSEKTSYSIGQENLNKPEISDAIKRAGAKISERTEITIDAVMHDIESIKSSAMRIRIRDDGEEEMMNYQAALKACELQGKRLGMFTDKLHVSGGISIEDLLKESQ
jgi:phage terminase small subunit